MHEGKKFKKSDILSENRKLLFEGVGNLLSPALVPPNTGGKGNRSPAPSLPVNILVLSDVVIFLQENNQKYNFVTPESFAERSRGARPCSDRAQRTRCEGITVRRYDGSSAAATRVRICRDGPACAVQATSRSDMVHRSGVVRCQRR